MSKYKCFYCGHVGPDSEFDTEHFVSQKARAKRRTLSPLYDERGIYAVLPDTAEVCYKCNRSKQDLSLGDWARWLAKNPDKWYPWDDGDRRKFFRWYLSLP